MCAAALQLKSSFLPLLLLCALTFTFSFDPSLGAAINGTRIETRIVGGTPNTAENLKYILRFEVNKKYECAGVLLNQSTALTAAHCCQGKSLRTVTVVGGTTNRTETGERRRLKKMILPSAWNRKPFHMDLCILILANPMKGKNTKPISLATECLQPGDTMECSGWGYLQENANILPNQVQSVNLTVIAKQDCKAYYSPAEITASMMCAKTPGKDTCSGDSGGPCVSKGTVVGITSFGDGCARGPGVYTELCKPIVQKAIREALSAA